MDAMSSKKQQLACLNRIQHAANQTWKVNANATSNNSGNGSDQSLTPFQRFECKLAQVIQPEKGAATIAALTCLKDANGRAEFILTSNSLKDTEIEDVVNFLRDLLTYTRDNPEDLKSKPLQKQVMWRILEFNFGKVRCYLQSLILALEQCIAECELKLNGANTGITAQLKELQRRATFPLDMISSQNARDKFMKDCETLIKAIEVSKGNTFAPWLENRVTKEMPHGNWHSLRHHLGRLHSFRQAADVIADAPRSFPELFKRFKVSYISSAKTRRSAQPQRIDIEKIFSDAFPEADLKEFELYLSDPDCYDLRDALASTSTASTLIHGEIHLHDYLIRQGKVRSSDFWEGSPFIASSKPTCQLCHYYFRSSDNNFKVQPSHMNLYLRWRLPESCSEDTLDDIIESMQAKTRQILKSQTAQFKRYDTSTDFHAGMSTASPIGTRANSRLTTPRNMGSMSRSEVGGARCASETMRHRAFVEDYDDEDEDEYMRSRNGHIIRSGQNAGLYIGAAV